MLNLVTDWLPEYAVFNKNIVFRMEFFTTVRDAGFGWSSFLPHSSGIDCPVYVAAEAVLRGLCLRSHIHRTNSSMRY